MGKYLDIAERIESPAGLSLPHNTGNSGNKPVCFNCGEAMTPTTDIDGKPLLECRACVVGDGTDIGRTESLGAAPVWSIRSLTMARSSRC
jgi:hypothetical protein